MRLARVAAALLLAWAGLATGSPLVPTNDMDVVEVLPGQTSDRVRQRQERAALAARPLDARLALDASRRLLTQARELGDPRFAGQALAALDAWKDDATMPVDLLVMKATLLQFLHEFDTAIGLLQTATKRDPAQAQAWLTLATVQRVRGRYAESDAACERLVALRVASFGEACLAENAALRGRWDDARRTVLRLIAGAQDADSRSWLYTTLAELEQRAGRPYQAEAAWQQVLAAGPDSYAALGYADLLLAQGRPRDAAQVLKGQVRSDAVVLRLAMAAALSGATSGPDIDDMRERIRLADLRPESRVFHGREQAMFELVVDKQARAAFELAKLNVTNQREALDILVLAQAAVATRDAAALAEARRVRDETGLRDARVDALL